MSTNRKAHFADRLFDAMQRKGSAICVGIDPVAARLPADLRQPEDADPRAVVGAFESFVNGVFDVVAPHAAAVKLQSACFERYLWPGVEAYHRLMHAAADHDLLVIADAKRGDIGVSASHYAAGLLADPPKFEGHTLAGPDSLTINSYLGDDAIEPFIHVAKETGKGLFVLVRTSNPGSDALQTLELRDGRQVVDAVAEMVQLLGDQEGCRGESGYSLLGAVVGATKPEDAARLRKLMPRQIFLVPGFGAQGGGADDVKACFNNDGRGAIITASRSILYAFEKQQGDWKDAIRGAAVEMKQQIADILK